MPNTATENDAIAGRMLAVLPRLHHTLRRDRLRGEPDLPDTKTLHDRAGQYRLLGLLATKGAMTTQQLAERMEVSAPTISNMIRRLAEAGMVERTRDAEDHRVAWHAITDTGRAVVEEEHRRWAEVFRRRFERLDEADRWAITAAIPALERLVDASPCREEG